jgi:hypothetical protein
MTDDKAAALDRVTILVKLLLGRCCKEPDTLMDLCTSICRFDRAPVVTALGLITVAIRGLPEQVQRMDGVTTFDVRDDDGHPIPVDQADPIAAAAGRSIVACINLDADAAHAFMTQFRRTYPDLMPRMVAHLTEVAHNYVHHGHRPVTVR